MGVLKRETDVSIGPQKAKRMLEFSKGNRSLRAAKIEGYMRDMRAGDWIHNGDAIRILPDGTLFDGHHRLTAIYESGVSIVTDIITVSEDAKPTVDNGAPRDAADHMVFEFGLSPDSAREMQRVARHVIVHDAGSTAWLSPTGARNEAKLTTISSIQEWYIENKEASLEALKWRQNNIARQHLLIPKGSVSAIWLLAVRVYPEENVSEYLRQVLTGYQSTPGTTQDHIRRGLLAAAMQQRKLPQKFRVASVVKGMKSVMSGRNIKHFGNAMFRPSVDNVPFLR